jgi:S-adenosylmethionine:tRNA ribosyltransferase-isomerase
MIPMKVVAIGPLMMMSSAFAGHEFILKAYREAKKHNYRFLSYGDAMLIV